MDWKHSLNLIEKISDNPKYIEILFQELGLDRWAYQNTALDSNVETNYPSTWVERYIDQDYFTLDPVTLYGESSGKPFLWEKSENVLHISRINCISGSTDLVTLSEEQLTFFEEAEVYNLNHGFLIPTGEKPDNASYAFAPELIPKDKIQQWCKEHIEYLQFICNVNYRLHKPRASKDISVTPKEREVLYWLSEGKSSWEVSKILNISERTVNFHTTNIKKKLQASNRSQIISAAFREKLIV